MWWGLKSCCTRVRVKITKNESQIVGVTVHQLTRLCWMSAKWNTLPLMSICDKCRQCVAHLAKAICHFSFLLQSSLKTWWHYDEYITSGQNLGAGIHVTNHITSSSQCTILRSPVNALLQREEKTKLLTWFVQEVGVSKKKRISGKPWHKNCTALFDHSDTAPTTFLLLLQHSQVHRDSQNTGAGRKEPVCTQQKCHFTGIKESKCAMHCHENGALCALYALCARLNPNHRTFKGFGRVCRELLHKIISDFCRNLQIVFVWI